jgi:hypothetical protein
MLLDVANLAIPFSMLASLRYLKSYKGTGTQKAGESGYCFMCHETKAGGASSVTVRMK